MTSCVVKTDWKKSQKCIPNLLFLFLLVVPIIFSFIIWWKRCFCIHRFCVFERYKIDKEKNKMFFFFSWRKQLSEQQQILRCFRSAKPILLKPTQERLYRALKEESDISLISFLIHHEVLQPQGSKDFRDLEWMIHATSVT